MVEILKREGIASRTPYAGLPTFWRSEYTQNLDAADLAVYGVPFDVEIFNRPGTRFGPRTIREQSLYIGMMGVHWPFDHDLRERLRIIDYGDIPFYPGDTAEMLTNLENSVTKMSERGIGTLGLGGDDLVAYPAIKAHAKKIWRAGVDSL